MAFTPKIDPQTIKNLRVIAKLYQENPSYFDETDYSVEIRMLVRDLVHTPPATEKSESSELLPKKKKTRGTLNMLEELQNTYDELTVAKPTNGEASAMMSYFRTKTALLEKLQEQMVQAQNSKQLSEFYTAVLTFLEETLDATQRAVFQEKLKNFINHE